MEKTKLEIQYWGSKFLQTRCKPVKEFTDRISEIFDEMQVLMKISDGIGLAANQVGMNLRMVVIETKEGLFKLVNPVITKRKGKIKFKEGCLSFPGISLNIKRANKVWVSSFDDKGNSFEIEAEGLLAVVLQHEIDHINGIVFIDRVPFLKKLSLRKKLKEIEKKDKDGL